MGKLEWKKKLAYHRAMTMKETPNLRERIFFSISTPMGNLDQIISCLKATLLIITHECRMKMLIIIFILHA